ncbi:hypothetical protein F4779DRAFT_623218 [Xylariaceae sp. FL0662B]|nr:hypothetical protein F4779DRAFT_623218 [Xylariaceae sp. FL0662B]
MLDDAPNARTDRRRRRPALACVSCRKSKIRCDRNLPCGACIRSKHKTCVFDPQGSPSLRQPGISFTDVGQSHTTNTHPNFSSVEAPVSAELGAGPTLLGDISNDEHSSISLGGSTPIGSTSSQNRGPAFNVDSLLERIRELERRLEEFTTHQPASKNIPRSSPTDIQPINSYLTGNFHLMSKSVMSKTRYLGQSHWMNLISNLTPVLDLFEQEYKSNNPDRIMAVFKCKSLARTIKAQRIPKLGFKFGSNIPPRDIADKLVDGYLRTLESVFRILHVPSFRKEYEKFWSSSHSVDSSFVIQLQLVMAIGSTIYDEEFTMRKSAVQWVYEAQCWLIAPTPKSKLTIMGLQIMLLLSLAREAASIGADLVWLSAGQIIRTAIYMGLHRDPKKLHNMTPFISEMRRRIWNTILEIALQSSIDSGGPPLISPDSYDTCAPVDCDDDQLTDGSPQLIAKPSDKFTDMSIPLALRASFPARLAITRLLNTTFSKTPYDNTIRLHGQLSAAYKSLLHGLQAFDPSGRQPTAFQLRFADFLVRRYFMALHIPYIGPATSEPAYAFSKKHGVETAAKLYLTVFPSAAVDCTQSKPPVKGAEAVRIVNDTDDLARYITCGSGFFRNVICEAVLVLYIGVQTQLLEDDGLGLPTPRPDLFNILHHAKRFLLRRVQAGETNVKGYMFHAANLAYIEALMRGLKGAALLQPTIDAGVEAALEASEILKQHAGQTPSQGSTTGSGQANFADMMGMETDWEYDMPMQNIFFNFASVGSMLDEDGDPDLAIPEPQIW